jgi:hypothetical protein
VECGPCRVVLAVGPVVVNVDTHNEKACPWSRGERFNEDAAIYNRLDKAFREEESIAVRAPNPAGVAKARYIAGDLEPIARAVRGTSFVSEDLPPFRDGCPERAAPGL